MNLKTKFSLIVIAATAIPCLILGFIAYNISKGVITNNITNNLLISLENSMQKIDRLLFERSTTVEQWAGNSTIRTALDFRWGSKEAQDVMRAFKKSSGGSVREITLVDTDCMCFVSTDDEHTRKQTTWHDTQWWKRSSDGEVFFSDWEVLDKKKNLAGLVFSAPIIKRVQDATAIQNYQYLGVLAVFIDWSIVEAELTYLKDLSRDMGVEAFSLLLLGDGKTVIAHSDHRQYGAAISNTFSDDKIRLMQKQYAGLFTTEYEGDPYTISFIRSRGFQAYPGFNWTLIMGARNKDIFRSLGFLYTSFAGVGIAIGVLMLIVGLIFTYRVLSPLSLLANKMRVVKKGDYDVQVDIETGDEIEDLSKSFNEMVVGLREKEAIQAEQEKMKRHAEASQIRHDELTKFNTTLRTTVDKLTYVGMSLSAQRNLTILLETIVKEAASATDADGGTLYIMEDGYLHFRIVQNRSKNIAMGGASGEEITFAPIPVTKDNIDNISAYCALGKEIVNIENVYDKTTFDMSGPKNFDENAGYETKSMLVLPMMNRQREVIGVLQLINSMDPATGQIVSFDKTKEEIANSLASQAAVSIENALSYEKIERKNKAFERFVPIEFLRCLGKEEVEEIELGDASYEDLSVLFSDIRSFTNLSETMSPEENFRFLNDYLEFIGPVIARNGGFIDKYIGDAIMALFSGIKSGVADDAVAAAIGMQQKLREFNQSREKAGLIPVAIGVGIHTGPLTLGTIGFEERIESTVIGDTVNLASRIEGLTKKYGVKVAITNYTFDLLKDPSQFLIREIDTVQVKGKELPVTLYDVFSSDSDDIIEMKQQYLERYLEGLSLYRNRKWKKACVHFEELLTSYPSENVLGIYLERCRTFLESPPDKDWDGVTKLYEK